MKGVGGWVGGGCSAHAHTRQIPADPQQWPAAAQVHRAGFCDDNRQSRLRLRAIPLQQTVSPPLYHYNGTSSWPRASLPR